MSISVFLCQGRCTFYSYLLVFREPFSFGGIQHSKMGEPDITGDGGLEFFTIRRKVTTKWAPPEEQSWLS